MKTSQLLHAGIRQYFFSLLTVLAVFGINPFSAGATEEVFYGGLQRQQLLVANPSFEVADTFPAIVDQTISVKDMIWLTIDEDTLLKTTTFTHWVDVTIDKYDANNNLIGTETNVRFTVSFNPAEGTTYKYGYVYEFANVYRFKVTVTNKSASFPAYMRLDGKITINRKYPFDCAASPVLLQKTHADLINTSTNMLQTGWQKQAGAEEYDLEWAFYDTLSPIITQASGSSTNFDFIFKNSATRITTGQTWYNIPLSYPQGRIYWRVRGVRYKSGKRDVGKWTSVKAVSSTLLARKEWYWVSPHEQGLNWEMQSVFAEEGKKTQSVAYFDGSLRNRQKVVRTDANNMTIASETIYDSLGRAAIQVMPAPVSFGTGVNDWTRGIKYNSSFSAAQGKTFYSPVDFNFVSTNCSVATTNPAAKMDTVNSAVGRYYSANNPWKDRFINKFTPAAEGYPFSLTEYMPDGTGRIRRQGGVGPTFQLGSGHETKYFYSKPEQVELDRLFGNEVGLAAHYQKNAVMDPNGQLSVTYIDAHGRTIATALAGAVPKDGANDRLQQLPNFSAGTRLKKDMLNNVREGTALVSTYTLLVTNDGARDSIIYAFYPKLELSIDSCLGVTRCYDCKYDVEIKVLSECGDPIINFSKTNFTAGVFDLQCGVLPDTLYRLFDLNPGLKVGQYQVTKTIKINESALNFYASDYLKNLVCLPTINTLQNNILGDTSCNKTCQDCYNKLGGLPAFRTKYLLGVPSPTSEDYANADSAYYRADRACRQLCDNGDPSDCSGMYEAMLLDMYPGGQYAEYNTITGPDPDGDLTYTASTDLTSVFYAPPGQPYPFQLAATLEGGTNLYKDEFGNTDYVIRPDSTKTRIDSLTLNEFISNFKPSWVKTLVKTHPEYCSYLCCKSNSNPSWDSLFSTVTTYSQAVALGYLPISTLVMNDPFFVANPTLKDSLLNIWNSYTTTAPGACSTPISLTEILMSTIYCNGMLPCPNVPGSGCTADNNMYWQMVQSHYLSEKSRLKWNKIRSGSCPPVVPSNSFCKLSSQICFGKPTCGAVNPNPYQNKVSRIFFQQMPLTGEAAEDSLYSLVDTVKIKLASVCDTACVGMAEQWIQTLRLTCGAVAGATPAQLTELRTRFVAVCKNGCDSNHPFGSVTTNGTATVPYNDQNLQDVINKMFFAGADSSCNVGCSTKLLDFPGTFNVKQYMVPPQVASAHDSCACLRLTALNSCWSAVGQPSLLAYINSTSNVTITQAELTKLQDGCNSECKFLDGAIPMPPILECGTCKTLTEVQAEWNNFLATCSDTATLAKRNLLAGHLNRFFGLNRNYADYRAFVTGPQTNPGCRYLCPNSRFPEAKLDTSCVSLDLKEGSFSMANLSYNNMLDSMRRVFVRNYLGKCLGPELLEKFEARISQGEYQFTLYYYDQAGNLVRTVPPKGVTPLTLAADFTAVKNHRANPVNAPKYPGHGFITRYWYNSLNQIVRDSTPDRGYSDYWYDKLGRLVLSQNSKQRVNNDYSYTLYDQLGRSNESGRVRKTALGLATVGTIWDYAAFTTWLTQNLVGNYEVTQSYYDDIIPGSSATLSPYFPNADGTTGQTNLRNRIASVTFEDTRDSDPLTFSTATHYSYDVSGNVKQMLQDIPELNINASNNHRFKRIAYDYDLISGKVNFVYYQKDSIDQFMHHYVYDADNRVQFVETSRDGLVWERDANYEYYLHGPMGRTELGERRVQGLDYAYTLQGWLKGVNASALSLTSPLVADLKTRDMGRDGKSSNTGELARNKMVARDVVGFTLGYYYGDYRKLNTVSADNFEMKYGATADFNLASSSLYNGNIRHAVYTIARLNEVNGYAQPEGYTYKYDQLNRLKSMRARTNSTLDTTNTWNVIAAERTEFKEDVSYDPNGNILTYQRNGNNSAQFVMDNLTYNYPTNNNKLDYITEAQTNQTAYTSDLDVQSAGNYAYDAIGNLIQDTRDSVSSITWTNAQKINAVNKTDRSISFKYDPMQNRVVKYSKPNSSNLEKRTYYIRDGQGNVMATYAGYVKNNAGVITWDSLYLREQHIYGSSRVGMALPNVKLYVNGQGVPKNPHLPDTSHYAIFEGWKRYEIANHLGNVLSVITDRKRGNAVSGTAIQWFEADVVAAQQYYPFGMLMPGNANVGLRRQYTLNSADYRYGFNGKEGDDEVKGDDNQQDYGMRIYDPRVARFLSVDPIAKEYPWYTPYQFAGNQPIWSIDLDGEEEKHYQLTFDKSGAAVLTYLYQKDIKTNHFRSTASGGERSWEVTHTTVNDHEEYILHTTTRRSVATHLGNEFIDYPISIKFTNWEKANKITQKDVEDEFSVHWAVRQHQENLIDAGITPWSEGMNVSSGRVARRAVANVSLDDFVPDNLTVLSKQEMNSIKGGGLFDRVKPRKSTLDAVTEKHPKNSFGELLNPYTGQVLDPDAIDLGHIPGEEWRVRKEMHKNKGSTRKEILDAENDPNLYQWEDRHDNRSHRYEKKHDGSIPE